MHNSLCKSKKILCDAKNDKSKKRANARQKTGPGVWPRGGEGFFRLDFLVLLCQDKRTSLRGNERDRTSYLNENISTEELSILYSKHVRFAYLSRFFVS